MSHISKYFEISNIVKYYEILSWEGWVEERAGEAGWVSGRGHLHPHRPSEQGKQDDDVHDDDNDDDDDGDGNYDDDDVANGEVHNQET